MKQLGKAIILSIGSLCAGLAVSADSEEALLEQVRTGQIGNRAAQAQMLAQFRASGDQARLMAQARAKRDTLQGTSETLEKTARNNKIAYDAKLLELREAMGPNAALFGSLQQIATELTGIFRNSPTSLDYPARETWLAEFGQRMEKSTQIFTIEELEKLWFLLQQEITASGQVVKVDGEVIGETGDREQRQIVRVGKFVLVSAEPEPVYMSWEPESQRASVLKRQPEGEYVGHIKGFVSNNSGVEAIGIDPTAGALMSRLVDAPSLSDRIGQGGTIGYLILALGAVGVGLAIFKLFSIMILSGKVDAQKRNLTKPSSDNPLGRMLRIYEDNKDVDTETLEVRLGEAILEERPKVDRFVGLIKVIATVAPLMGLMGTVIGMIATFQAITLFGTGDPKTMAGGISQALVTTVLGLTVAIPTVLLHAIVSSRAAAVVNTLKHQTAGLISERMEARAAGQ